MTGTGRERPERPPTLPELQWFEIKGDEGEPVRRGWRRQLPGRRPLATPAVVDGRVFSGGGFGSFEFYAFDLESGRHDWTYRTADDGPTAAVVSDGFVAFNTESCELEVLTVEGKFAWKHWLGDPLMSMPAIADGVIYMVYPQSRGDHGHRLAAFGLADGTRLWEHPISGEVITAPVVAGEHVYATTLDGVVWCLDRQSGRLSWRDAMQATSAPMIYGGRCHVSLRERPAGRPTTDNVVEPTVETDLYETQGTRSWQDGKKVIHTLEQTRHKADYLHFARRKRGSAKFRSDSYHDSLVGFAASKGHSKMHQAERLLGRGTVAGMWSYQGSKPFIANGRMFSSMGETLKCVDPESGELHWERNLVGGKDAVDSLVTPPSLAGGKVFAGTDRGIVHCLAESTGDELWRVSLGQPIVFQPAVTAGWCVVGLADGTLAAFETGDPADDGWRMWGGTAAHNGLTDEEEPAEVFPSDREELSVSVR